MALALGQALPPQPQASPITFRPCQPLVTQTTYQPAYRLIPRSICIAMIVVNARLNKPLSFTIP